MNFVLLFEGDHGEEEGGGEEDRREVREGEGGAQGQAS